MPSYRYRCPRCGPFEVRRPIGQASPEETCAGCRSAARRVFTPPLLTRTPPALARALQAQAASAAEPQVVRAGPAAGRRRPAPADPRQARLPRP